MTPELWKELIIGVFTAAFTGIPAMLLFWWTWRRDQERVLVQKILPFTQDENGAIALMQDEVGPKFGLVVRNRSLFSVYLSHAAFEIDGELLPLWN